MISAKLIVLIVCIVCIVLSLILSLIQEINDHNDKTIQTISINRVSFQKIAICDFWFGKRPKCTEIHESQKEALVNYLLK